MQEQYWTRNGCRKGACGQVHLCKLFLAGICTFERRCRNEHTLKSEHNKYWTRNGCRKGACGQVHLCKLFLAGICKFGHMCRNEHSLQSEHNKVVCTEEASRSEEQLIAELRRRFAEEGFVDQKFYCSHIEICPNQAESCRIHDCIRVHICRDYVTGTCSHPESCRFSHVLRSPHNNNVLGLYKAVDMNDRDLLNLLCARITKRGAKSSKE
ncbi:Poly [ADP-ribose] polymerase 12 [Amphibalanus amphitrite]|uniref:Poly [ADP-ribose] polymerase 12 n=1 Tax=Amphibalanus amphitrite TaxID=1232801 RepID=A0A6A4WRI1_AMPAM|nr:Poly [ADP-ribose] polymerase 12 [Amphibalanus amphitrite]